ncbi:MAG: CvpA family protein, partial [Desulfatiglandales bacterium]
LGIAQGPGLGLGCFLLIFLATYVSVRLIAWLFTHMLGSGALGMVNRLLGGGVATLKASIVVCVGVALLSFVLPGRSALLKESVIAPYALKLYGAVSSRITPDMYKNWKGKFQSSPPSEGKKDPKGNPI